MFHPYLKKDILECDKATFVDDFLLAQLQSDLLSEFVEGEFLQVVIPEDDLVGNSNERKRPKLMLVKNMQRTSRPNNESAEDEYKRYKVLNLTDCDVDCLFGNKNSESLDIVDCWYSDVLKWWKQNQVVYPRMAALARYYLAIPASSAFAERCFSSASNNRSIKRTSMSEEKLEMMVVLRTIDPELWSMVSSVIDGQFDTE